jgi:hypothetical protein
LDLILAVFHVIPERPAFQDSAIRGIHKAELLSGIYKCLPLGTDARQKRAGMTRNFYFLR